MKSLRGWEFDELEGKSTATKKPNSYREKVKVNNVFPLLAFYDGFIRFEQQKRCYSARFVNIIEKGHVTAALSPSLLRKHILGVVEMGKYQR